LRGRYGQYYIVISNPCSGDFDVIVNYIIQSTPQLHTFRS
jgi:hypothetical protein